jgi:hypothetical protein
MAEQPLDSLDECAVDRALEKAERGLRQYLWIQSRVWAVDVRSDAEFQRKYNHFYRVRCNEDWRRGYFRLMEQSKGTTITFANALETLAGIAGRLEASFASKLVATLDPNQPVIDSFVLGCCGLSLPPPSLDAGARRMAAVALHNRLIDWYAALERSAKGLMIRERFTLRYPWAAVSELKKLDFVLWQHRPATAQPEAAAGGH